MSDRLPPGVRDRDDERLPITVTRRQWRAIKAEIGDFWAGANDALWDELDTWDLEKEAS